MFTSSLTKMRTNESFKLVNIHGNKHAKKVDLICKSDLSFNKLFLIMYFQIINKWRVENTFLYFMYTCV